MNEVYILENTNEKSENMITNLKNYIMIENMPLQIAMKSDSLLELVHHLNYIHLYNGIFILDLDTCKYLPNGIDFAAYVRSKSILAQFIFISSNTNISFSIIKHRVEPFDLIDKKLDPKEIIARIKQDLKILSDQLKNQKLLSFNFFSFVKERQIYSLPLENLIYLQTVPSKPGLIELHSLKRKTIFSGTLNKIEQKYPTFFRCQKSILINPNHIAKFQPNTRFIYMDNGDKLEVSTRKVTVLKKVLLN